ncbi:hypothetical protein [Streptomyces sp. NPDC020983]|uniref:hypothetical protein n=1 Tax=Streptomyces sp. NPDC020983 TaxID=3365106 RepID=UPI0037ACB803
MTTNFLLSRPRRIAKDAVQDFRNEHGPVEEWSGHDIEVYLDFVSAAHRPGLLARQWLRLRLLLWELSAMPVYALSELLWAAQNRVYSCLNVAMDWLDDRCSAVESQCRQAGDGGLVESFGRVSDLVSDVANSAGRKASRLVRG